MTEPGSCETVYIGKYNIYNTAYTNKNVKKKMLNIKKKKKNGECIALICKTLNLQVGDMWTHTRHGFGPQLPLSPTLSNYAAVQNGLATNCSLILFSPTGK